MNRLIGLSLFLFLVLGLPASCANKEQADNLLFEHLFEKWTKAFNSKDLSASMSLFSKEIAADYRGVPRKNFDVIRDGFKKTFAQKNRQCQYQFKVHEVYRSGKFAAVRITWYLRISEAGKPDSISQDEGMDVFKQEADGNWRIVNYIAYEVEQKAEPKAN
jgi:uncharacterized protein (TIGR02246 family)